MLMDKQHRETGHGKQNTLIIVCSQEAFVYYLMNVKPCGSKKGKRCVSETTKHTFILTFILRKSRKSGKFINIIKWPQSKIPGDKKATAACTVPGPAMKISSSRKS